MARPRSRAPFVGTQPQAGGLIALCSFRGDVIAGGAFSGSFQASLHRYATAGDAGPFIDTGLARQAFQPADA